VPLITSVVRDRRGPALRRTAAVAGLMALTLLTAACGSDGKHSAGAAASHPSGTTSGSASNPACGTSAPAEPAPTATIKVAPPKSWGGISDVHATVHLASVSLIAQAAVPSVKVFASATAATAQLTLANPLPSGAHLVFLEQERRGDRFRVLLPVRPNGSQGWVRASDVTVVPTPYHIAVSVRGHTLTLYQGASAVLSVPAGIGTSSTPTPGGVFYIKELKQPPDPNGAYGPYAFGLSGYSPVLTDFNGGNGEIGIHGTNEPSSVGKNVSHGCIRVSNADITRLAKMLPLGTPVQIVN
jgi:lipoprotein-anchoring transpeptidase ErfK/SrfK